MLSEWTNHGALAASGVGAFGFSSGGFTVLAAAGGDPDLSLFAPHCVAHPANFDCALVAAHGGHVHGPQAFVHDRRISALVVAAPALGFTFAHGLSSVTQPVQLWRADDDRILPAPEYADAVAAALPSPPQFHAVPNADHWDFLAPCSDALARAVPMICKSAPGFDRAAFHASFDEAVVAFFKANLR